MKTLVPGDKPTISRLAERLKTAQSHSEYQVTVRSDHLVGVE